MKPVSRCAPYLCHHCIFFVVYPCVLDLCSASYAVALAVAACYESQLHQQVVGWCMCEGGILQRHRKNSR